VCKKRGCFSEEVPYRLGGREAAFFRGKREHDSPRSSEGEGKGHCQERPLLSKPKEKNNLIHLIDVKRR